MRVIESGRFLLPVDAHVARRFAEENLLSIHARSERLRAIAFGARLRGIVRETDEQFPGREWLLMRRTGRDIVFVFEDALRYVIKRGPSLAREAEVLRALDLPGIPRVERFDEELVLTPIAGRPLFISMQRSLRPRRAHAAHLANAGRWLGRFHAATRRGEEVATHGDFWARNILFEGDEVSGVVDWEHGALRGAPWNDLFTLPLLFVRDAPRWIARNPSWRGVPDIIDAYFRAYVAEAGGDARSLGKEFERWASASSG